MIKITKDNHFFWNKIFPFGVIFNLFLVLVGSIIGGLWPIYIVCGVFFIWFFLVPSSKISRFWKLKEMYYDDGKLLLEDENGILEELDRKNITKTLTRSGITEIYLKDQKVIYIILANAENVSLFDDYS